LGKKDKKEKLSKNEKSKDCLHYINKKWKSQSLTGTSYLVEEKSARLDNLSR
jgi:hypothetical protein